MNTHKEKQSIFDEYARLQGYPFWSHLFEIMLADENYDLLQEHIYQACDLVQQEQQKRIAENVMMKNHDGTSKKNRNLTYFQNGADNIQIDKATITSPDNLIK